MKAVIPAAGLGTRFLPLSQVVPKELLLLGDRPVLHHALDEAARGGFEAAVVVTAPWKRPLFDAYLVAAAIELPVTFVDQPDPHGIGDAVLRAVPAAGDRFGVLLPDDVVTESTHWKALRAAPGPALCVRPVPPETIDRFGIVVLDGAGRPVEVVEKPPVGSVASNLAIFGRYIVTPAVLDRLAASQPAGELQLTEGFAGQPDLAVVSFEGEIYDCGTPAAYQEACARYPRSAVENLENVRPPSADR